MSPEGLVSGCTGGGGVRRQCPALVLTLFSSFFLGPEDGELYSGTSYNFLGSEPIISRNSSHSPLRTEYAIPWLNGKTWGWSSEVCFYSDSFLARRDAPAPLHCSFCWLNITGAA